MGSKMAASDLENPLRFKALSRLMPWESRTIACNAAPSNASAGLLSSCLATMGGNAYQSERHTTWVAELPEMQQ